MNILNDLKINKNLYLLIFLLLYVSDETLLFGTQIDNGFFWGIKILIYVALFVFSIKDLFLKYQYENREMIMYYTFFILGTVVCMLINFDFNGGNIYQIIIYTIAVSLCCKYSFSSFIRAYDNIFYVLCICGLLLYMMILIEPALLNQARIIGNVLESSSRVAILYEFLGVILDTGMTLRNALFFREPGVYMIFILIALFINYFFYERQNYVKIAIYNVSMLTTMSSAGILLGVMTLILFLLVKERYSILALVVLVALALYYLSTFVESEFFIRVFGKFSAESDSYRSTMSRVSSVVIPCHMIFYNPITGVGIANFSTLYSSISYDLYNEYFYAAGNSTNFILNRFATYGIFLGILSLKMLWGFCHKLLLNRNYTTIFLMFIILFAAFSNEDVRYSVFFNMLLFYGLENSKTMRTISIH